MAAAKRVRHRHGTYYMALRAGPHEGFDAWQTSPRTTKSPSAAGYVYAERVLASPSKSSGLELGYDQGWISHIENGRTNPAYGTVDLLARALAWPISRLVILAESVKRGETEDRKPLDRPLRDSRVEA